MDPERDILGALPPRRDDSPDFLDKEARFWAEVVTEVGSGKYTFKEKVRNNATTWKDKSGGRTGDCYEANDLEGITVGTIIQIRIEHDAGGILRYLFDIQDIVATTGAAEAVVVRFKIWNNGEVTLSSNDWRARPIEYDVHFWDGEHEGSETQQVAWDRPCGDYTKIWFIGADPTGDDEYDIFDISLVGAAKARLYVDDGDGGKLKFECYGFAGPLHMNMVLVVKGFIQRTLADAIQIGEEE